MHWTSAERRCHRQLGKRFGDQAYAIEEVVAELGAAFLCADLRITDEPRADHAHFRTSAATRQTSWHPSAIRGIPENICSL